MEELIKWFIETSSIDGNYLAGMIFAAVVVLSILCLTGYQMLALIIGWFGRFKPIKIAPPKKNDPTQHIVDFPPEVEQSFEEVFKRLDAIDKKLK